jgi:thiol-disulfide isomerase/thioredoxin
LSSRFLKTLAVAVTVLAAPFAAPPAAADELRLGGLGGGQLTSADLERGVTMLIVWASWSPRCRDIPERVAALESTWGGRARLVTVNFQETEDEARAMASRLRVPVFLDRDGVFSKQHALATLPALVVYRDGEVAYQGRLPDAPDGLLRELLP